MVKTLINHNCNKYSGSCQRSCRIDWRDQNVKHKGKDNTS